MKPEKLIICGWGPYKEETVIDFEKMNTSGLFLVTGQTGAGKTTIFDAIAYALYGVLSGDVREKGTVRSDFADPDTKTYVELFMRHKNEQYHISRNPEYQRPKKRKSGESAFTKEKENAVLTMPDGSIIAGNQDVTEKIEELLHMDGKQFRQISMIAQGEFSKMLFADSKDKNAIFRELFGTGIYASVQTELKNRSAKLYRDYMVYKNKMEEDVHLLPLQGEEWVTLTSSDKLDFEAIEKYLEIRLEEEKEYAGKQMDIEKRLEEELLSLQKERAAVRQLNARFRELDDVKQKLDTLKSREEEIKQLEQKMQSVKRAQVLFLEEKVVLEKEKALTEVSKREGILKTELSELKEQVESLGNIAEKKDKIQAAFVISEQLQELQKQGRMLETKKKQAQEQLDAARTEYEQAQSVAKEKQRQYEEADVRYKQAVIGIAAKLVRDGEPCPVCGSLDHPKVAQISEDVPDEKQLELWKQEADKSRAEATRCYEKAFSFVNEEKQFADRLEECALHSKELADELAVFDEVVHSYVGSYSAKEFDQTIKNYLESNTKIVEKEKQLKDNETEYVRKRKEAEVSRKDLETKIAESGFHNRNEYEQAVSMLNKLEAWEKEVRTYRDELVAAENLHEHLQTALDGLSPKDEAPLQEIFAGKQAEKNASRKLVEESNVRINQMQRSLSGIRKNRVEADAISKEYGIVKDLDDLANGNNARRLVFEQYVLAGYFEKILQAANLRLINMTDGRYELQRAPQVGDGRKKDNLEILVMDYYTGRKRSVKTLSGGETFKASLALALGMSDCIQAENGGIEVETLFIDEGFGALDEESLEQACTTLQMLAGNNRMIGIISHVAQLRERIEHQIIIEKRNNGSCVKVC